MAGQDLEQKRIFSADAEADAVLVAAEIGVASVSASGEQIGRFGLELRCAARDVAARCGQAAVAAADAVYLSGGGGFAPADLGPSTAVGYDGDDLVVASENGVVARRVDGAWDDAGALDAPVRAVDGDFLAAADGLYRLDGGLSHVGLDDARDVAAAGVPHAATADGLYRLGNGWMDVLDGAFTVVAVDAAEAEPGAIGRAHAVGDGILYEHREGEWTERAVPVDDPVVDVAYGGGTTFAVTESGTFLLDAGGEWRTRELGLRGAVGLAVP